MFCAIFAPSLITKGKESQCCIHYITMWLGKQQNISNMIYFVYHIRYKNTLHVLICSTDSCSCSRRCDTFIRRFNFWNWHFNKCWCGFHRIQAGLSYTFQTIVIIRLCDVVLNHTPTLDLEPLMMLLILKPTGIHCSLNIQSFCQKIEHICSFSTNLLKIKNCTSSNFIRIKIFKWNYTIFIFTLLFDALLW